MVLSHRDFEQMAGCKLGPKLVMYALPDSVWRRLENGSWERYPDYPEAPISKSA